MITRIFPKLIFLSALTVSVQLFALPFNTDMFQSDKLSPGETVRNSVPGTVPVGALEGYVPSKDAALELTNPLAGDPDAVWKGQRLYEVNCAPCHGWFDEKKVEPAPVMGKMLMMGPDLSLQAYKEKTDGLIYGTIHFGGYVFMPPVGFKLSPQETWEIVSYLRYIQNQE